MVVRKVEVARFKRKSINESAVGRRPLQEI